MTDSSIHTPSSRALVARRRGPHGAQILAQDSGSAPFRPAGPRGGHGRWFFSGGVPDSGTGRFAGFLHTDPASQPDGGGRSRPRASPSGAQQPRRRGAEET